jgi:hypothetical protein
MDLGEKGIGHELELHGTKSQKASVIDTAVKASQKTVIFDH